MENASKALLIAGAVLIAIVLITIGIVILNKSKSTTDQAGQTANVMNDTAGSAVTKLNETNISF